jgi:hypothetical protein
MSFNFIGIQRERADHEKSVDGSGHRRKNRPAKRKE